jgi:hypothetical protein
MRFIRFVMPALVAGIHVFKAAQQRRGWPEQSGHDVETMTRTSIYDALNDRQYEHHLVARGDRRPDLAPGLHRRGKSRRGEADCAANIA